MCSGSGMQATTSCGSSQVTMQSTASQSALPASQSTVDKSLPMWWHMLSRPEQLRADAAAHKAVDLLWFVHGLSFNLIGSPLFRDAVAKIKLAPCYKPCHRTTLSTTHLAARNVDADEFKIKRLQHGKQYGFLITSDGWRNKKRRSYHNFILVAANGPIFLLGDPSRRPKQIWLYQNVFRGPMAAVQFRYRSKAAEYTRSF